MDALEAVAARLQEAVASQAYAEAQNLVPVYCAVLEREFAKHPASSPEARRIAEDAKSLYQWMARAVVLDRAHCATALQRLANLSTYLETGNRTPHTYELQG
jgi:hypothetical protein